MDIPFFSIIIPVYKVRQDYLETCVESIRNQSFRDLEIILVDDGSPDNCGALCDEYAKKDTRIKVIHQANQGVSVARNAGIEAAQGEWTMFVDADDWIAETACDILAEQLEVFDGEILMYSHIKVYNGQQIQAYYNLDADTTYDASQAENRENLYRIAMRPTQGKASGVYFCWDKAYRHSFLQEYNLRFPIGVPKSEDKVFTLLCFEKANRFRFSNQPFYFYRINAGSVCNRYSETADTDRFQLARILLSIAERMDAEIGELKGNKEYSVLTNDCKRFLFGIISDVFSLKFFHPDCSYSKRERKATAKKFVETDPFHGCIQDMKYEQLSMSAKLKKFLLQRGWVGIYNNIYKLMLRLSNRKAQNG